MFLLITFLFLTFNSIAQDNKTDAGNVTQYNIPDSLKGRIFTERLLKMVPTNRVFLTSNSNGSLDPGDFITILKMTKPVIRCAVAKRSDKEAGIKVLKIYSLALWNSLKDGDEVQILRGDDSEILALEKKSLAPVEGTEKIKGDEDLFAAEQNIEIDINEIEGNPNRKIKQDNLISGNYGQISSVDSDGESNRVTHLNASWGYQFADNFWGEGVYGYSALAQYPSESLDTTLHNFTLRLKYTVSAPAESFLMPYAGVQIIRATSPSAGEDDGTEATSDAAKKLKNERLAQEKADVEALNEVKPVFGVTFLKRFVPAWYGKIELGTDIFAVGLALEF